MANTVNILSYNNTFGDLVAQQNKAAVELNNLAGGVSSNNFTKDTGTLFLNGVGVALSVANTVSLGRAIVSGNTSLLGDLVATANVAITGSDFALQVANNAVIAKTLITDSITSNTLVRTATVNASGGAFVNGITANTLIRTVNLNAFGFVVADSLTSNTAIFAPLINASTTGIFNNITCNNAISTSSIAGAYSGVATLSAGSTAVTGDLNANTTTVATTQFVKTALNSGNTFNIAVVNGVVNNGSYANPSWITSLAGSKITGDIAGSSANLSSYTINQSVSTGNDVQFRSVGVGTAGSGTTGELRATNNITAYYSDDRLKKRLGNIENALAKVMSLNGFQYEANETAQALGYTVKPEIGLSAQEVQAVLPEVVVPAPIDEQYLTIHYERVIPLLVEAIKELKKELDSIRKPLDNELNN
jgi:hypothetical protein